MFCQPLTVVYVCHSQPLLKEEEGEGKKGELDSFVSPAENSQKQNLDGNFFVTFLSKLAYLALSSETNKL